MSKFKMNSTASKTAAKKAQERGGSRERWKMKTEKATLLLVGPVQENEPVFGVNDMHLHFGSDNSFICKSATPRAFEQKDKLIDIAWKLKNKFDPKEGDSHPNKKIRDLWKSFMPRKTYTINIIDLSDLEKGVQQFDAPMAVMEVIFEAIDENGDDLGPICDFKQGKRLLIKKSGKGFSTKYKAGFGEKPANLDLSPEEEDALADQVKPLSKMQESFDEAQYAKVVDYLTNKAKKLGIELDELDEDNENEEVVTDDDAVESEELTDELEEEIVETDDEELSDELSDDVETKPAAGKTKKK